MRSRLVAGSPDSSPASSMAISDSSRPVSSADASPLVGKPGTTTQHAKTTAQMPDALLIGKFFSLKSTRENQVICLKLTF